MIYQIKYIRWNKSHKKGQTYTELAEAPSMTDASRLYDSDEQIQIEHIVCIGPVVRRHEAGKEE